MNKKYLLVLLVIILVAAGIIILMKIGDNSTPSSAGQVQESTRPEQLSLKFSDMQANYPANPDQCLATSVDPSLKLDAGDQMAIESAVGMTVIDMPAGTNFDTYVKTYNETVATGTTVYESTYGSYNFTAEKAGQSTWLVTTFVACKK